MTNEKKLSLADQNRLRTTEKVVEALEKLKKSKAPITIKSVSDKANISRKTIYNRPDLKALIEETQSLQSDLKIATREESNPKGSTQAERIKRLREKNKLLIEEKKMVLEQNMILTTEVTNLKNRLADLEEKLYSMTNLKVVDISQKK
jgi:predicted nuclease with TOPRIM domain